MRASTYLILATTVVFVSTRVAADTTFRRPWSTSLTVDETYDSNLYLQSSTPLAERASWVTSISASFELATPQNLERGATLAYSPGWTHVHSASTEDFVVHRFSTGARLPLAGAAVSAQLSATITDGADEGIVWTGPGGPPATGAPAVRDRRDQSIYRGAVRAEWKNEYSTLRASGTLYWADFQTALRHTSGYQNYVDRGDFSLGVDALRTLAPKFHAGAGLRLGRQEQARVLGFPEDYDNQYVRLLALAEGPVSRWLSVALAVGPEFRHYGPRVHPTFADRSITNLFIDAAVSVAATRRDAIALVVREFQQMSSSGRGAFDDRNFDLAWRHTFTQRASGALVLHAYNTRFLRPALRDDWVHTARLQGTFAWTENWTLDASLLLEEGSSDVPRMAGREYIRQVVSLSLRTRF